jgi:tubulin-specific chaperone E
LRTKYIETQHGSASQEKVLLGSSNGAIEVEAVGLDKIRDKFAQLERLREISVDFENVAAADPPGEVHNTCPSMSSHSSCDIDTQMYVDVRGIDLSSNLLPSWDVVTLIAAELPMLQRLALKYAAMVASFQTY